MTTTGDDSPGAFGQRLRERRMAAGLSQTDLAGDSLSPSYVSLLEAGKRNPTGEILDYLAGRLGCDRSYLEFGSAHADQNQQRLALEYAELAIRNGEADDAVTQLDALLSSGVQLAAPLAWRARRLWATALEYVGRLEEAIQALDALRVDAVKDDAPTEELLISVDLVRCYQEVGDVTLAIEAGTATLERLKELSLSGSDEFAQLTSSLIGAYYERGDVTRAALMAKQAVAAVDANGSRKARASIYWNASLAREATGDAAGAVILAQRAVSLLAENDETRSLARLRTALGWLLLRQTPTDLEGASRELDAAHRALVDVGSQVDLAYCETERGRCALMDGDAEGALRYARTAAGRLEGAPRPELAHAMLIEGRALFMLGQVDEATGVYEAAGALLAQFKTSRQGAPAWRELGDAYADIGLAERAFGAYREALTYAGVHATPARVVSSRR